MSTPSRTSLAASLILSTLVPISLVISCCPPLARGRLYPIHQCRRATVRSSKPIIIVHGGTGDWPSELHKRGLAGVRIAADRGFRILSKTAPPSTQSRLQLSRWKTTQCLTLEEARPSI